MSPIELFWTAKDIQIYRYTDASICVIGRSEKYKSWVLQKAKEISEPRHSTDFRTVRGGVSPNDYNIICCIFINQLSKRSFRGVRPNDYDITYHHHHHPKTSYVTGYLL